MKINISKNLGERLAISPNEFSTLTGISLPSVYRYLKSGELKCKRFKGRILIPTTEIESLMEWGEYE